jgi:hypothetical protein
MKKVLMLLAVAAVIFVVGTISSFTLANAAITVRTTVCDPRQTVQVHVEDNSYYNVFNASQAVNRTCVSATPGRAQLVIDSTDQHADWGYPNISSGWEWGENSSLNAGGHHFVYPVKESNDGTPDTSMSVSQHGDGIVDYDIWFNQNDNHPKQNDGTEVLIWIRHPGVPSRGSQQVTIDGLRFIVANDGVVHNQYGSWHRINYILVSQHTSVRNVWLNPIFRNAISHHALSSNWFLTAIDLGDELTYHGSGTVINETLTGVK